MEPHKGGDNSINYQDLDVNQEEDEIYVVELQHGPPYTCQMLKIDKKNRNCLTRNIVLILLRQIKYLMYC